MSDLLLGAGGEQVLEPKENSDGTGFGNQGPELLRPTTFSRDYQINDNQKEVKKSKQAEIGGAHSKTRKRKGTSHAWPEFNFQPECPFSN